MTTAQPSQPESDTTPAADAAHAVPVPVPAPVEKKKGAGVKKAVAIVVAIVVAGVVKVGVGSLLSDEPVRAKAGECVHITGTDASPKAETTDCGSDKANFTVISVVDNTFSLDACNGVSGTDAALAQQLGTEKFVLCLAKKQ